MKTLFDSVPKSITEIKLSYHPKTPPYERPVVRCSQDAYELFISQWNVDSIALLEEFKVIYLNRANRVLGICHLSSGGLSGTVVDHRIILATALKCLATTIILAHNHPSGNLMPSGSDERVTERIATASRFHDISLSDHLIISPEGYFSFADEGKLRASFVHSI